MRLRSLILLILSISLLTACSSKAKEVVEPVPTGSIDNFEVDSKVVIKTIGSAVNEMTPLTDEQEQITQRFLDQYDKNPRLNEDQNDIVFDVSNLRIFYSTYFWYKESNSKLSNDSIKLVFDNLRMLEDDGYAIK